MECLFSLRFAAVLLLSTARLHPQPDNTVDAGRMKVPEMAKVVDLVAFVASTNSSSGYIDSFGSQCMFRSLGLRRTVVFIPDFRVQLRKRNDSKNVCSSSLAGEFLANCMFYPADKKDELLKTFSHSFCWTAVPLAIQGAKAHNASLEKPTAIPHSPEVLAMPTTVDIAVDDFNSGKCTLLVTGYLRAHSLSVNQLNPLLQAAWIVMPESENLTREQIEDEIKNIKAAHVEDAELIFHVGFQQFVARPLFSTDNMKSVDPDRIMLKIIPTDYPQRVSKSKASARYMFHHPEDVRSFKPVEVWAKCGHHGRIKEPVGTQEAMKCVFNGVLLQNDTVCMSLYNRAYPMWPEHLFPSVDAVRE
ncbi:hypothetical protein Tsubulata_045694 [Turnera subulata]|uniref:Ribosome biogenesis protein BMS1/TSR1 C-terminal domain-containing protein n=1 Tax=Turnera subulata TaxID=218843 RepID=A0A9Q0F3P0_9ROSI|nr:hypothetical protein Tsubulata_045694 [Turnera subulata]